MQILQKSQLLIFRKIFYGYFKFQCLGFLHESLIGKKSDGAAALRIFRTALSYAVMLLESSDEICGDTAIKTLVTAFRQINVPVLFVRCFHFFLFLYFFIEDTQKGRNRQYAEKVKNRIARAGRNKCIHHIF